jgi:hypothetical protein
MTTSVGRGWFDEGDLRVYLRLTFGGTGGLFLSGHSRFLSVMGYSDEISPDRVVTCQPSPAGGLAGRHRSTCAAPTVERRACRWTIFNYSL